MTPKWPTDYQIHFQMRSQYQNHHKELFSDSESQTGIDNIVLHLNPNLWNSSKMPTCTIGAETLPSHPKLDTDIHPSPKSSYEPVGTFKFRFRDRLLKSQNLVNSSNLKLKNLEFSFQINSKLSEIQFRPRVQVIIPEVKLLMASNRRTTC